MQRILINREYNDLGFTVKNKLIVLVEAQSTWSVNIVIRALIYLMSSYQDYLNNKDINIYNSRKIKLPKPELYVIYTKDRKRHPNEISLKKEYFPNEDCCIEAKVKVIYENKNNTVTSQYIGFCKVLDKCIKRHGRTQEAIEKAITICKNKNLLKEYLKQRETEVKGIMLTLFSEERVKELYGLEMQKQGIKKGRAEGKAEGHKEGMAEGRKEGKAEGKKEGRKEGIISTLYSLVQDGTFSMSQAAARAKMSVSEFEQQAKNLAGAGTRLCLQEIDDTMSDIISARCQHERLPA